LKVLFLYAEKFAYSPGEKVLDFVPEAAESVDFSDAVLAFVHVEAEDLERKSRILTRLVKYAKWLARKWGTRRIVVHSFSHLSESKAPPEFSGALLEEARKRLESAGYEAHLTPFGYVLELELRLPGRLLARAFQSF